MIHRWSIARKIAFGFALGPLALLIVGIISFVTANDLLGVQRTVLGSYDIVAASHRIELDLLNAETGQRAYLLTGDTAYLAPYTAARAALDRHLAAFAAAAAGDPDQEARLAAVRPLIDQKLAQLKATVDQREAHGTGNIGRSNRGRTMMQQIRDILTAALTAQERVAQTRYENAQSRTEWALAGIGFGTAGMIALLVFAGVLLTRNVSGPLEDAVAALTSASAEILAGSTQQAAGVQEQAAAVTETVSTVEEISLTTESANDRAKAVAESALRAAENGVAGVRAVEDTVSVMADVKTRTESIANSILALAEQAQAIGEIIAVVNDVADQTNMLAFNAAIEASRAGEHGRGFGVVATEIKSLAEQSKKATVQVRQILGEIQRATNSAVIATEQGAKTVDEALRAVNVADEAIRALTEIVADSARSATQISAAANQASIGMSQIQRAMRDISETTSQNLASTRQAEQAARGLDGVGLRLAELLRGTTV